MPLTIDNPKTLDAAERLADLTREPLQQAVDKAIKDKLARIEAERDAEWQQHWKRIEAIQRRVAEAPKFDTRRASEILEDLYDEDGLPR